MHADRKGKSGNPGYETRDTSLKLVVLLGVGVTVLSMLAFITMRGLFDVLDESARLRQPPPSTLRPDGPVLPPEPRLATHPTRALHEWRAVEKGILDSYGWVDPEEGVVHIPIERALELTLERGLPHNPGAHRGGRTMNSLRVSMGILAVVLPVTVLMAQDAPPGLEGIEIVQKLDESIPEDLEFRDSTGRPVNLREISAGRPMLLALVYYECPMLCTQVLTGLVQSLDVLQFDTGTEFDVVAVSIDPGEEPELAAAKKAQYMQRYGRPGAEKGWHFLTGEEDAIRRLADAVGFHYRYDAETDLYAHAAGIMVVTADGRLSRYFYGVEYAPRDVRFALVEAGENRIGTVVDQVLLWCFPYDPSTGKYSMAITRIIQAGGVLTVLGLVLFIGGNRLLEYRRVRREAA